MEIFGTSIENVYLFILIISGLLTVMYFFLGDFLEVFSDMPPLLNPALILAFITFLSAMAYILEIVTTFPPIHTLIISSLVAFILAMVLNIFIFIPLRSKGKSISDSERSFKGRIGEVILTVPKGGFGEIVIESERGTISKAASSLENIEIPHGKRVLVIEVKDEVLYVVPYESGMKSDDTMESPPNN